MRITFLRRGGFGGFTHSLELNCDELPAEQSRAIQDALQAARFAELPACLPAASEARDEFTYQLSVHTEAGVHTVEFSDSTTPSGLAPLVGMLSRLTRRNSQ